MEQFRGDYGGAYTEYSDIQRGATSPLRTTARHRVDPEAEEEIDPNLYPQPKEATHKIRSRSNIIEMLCGSVDQELLIVKSFYFFFYSAFGSLFPLISLYFKQMGMNPLQCGILIGMRPFVEFLSAPFWSSYADRYRKGKILLLASLACWIIFTLPLGFIQPKPIECVVIDNNTAYLVPLPQVTPRDQKRDISHMNLERQEQYKFNQLHRYRRNIVIIEDGVAPTNVKYASNYNEQQHKHFINPFYSSTVYRMSDIQKAFFILLLLVIIGGFFSASAITLADSAVITLLGKDADKYGHQRMFGSLGWGLAMISVGMALDYSSFVPNTPCVLERHMNNYNICFATFSVLMAAAFITATQITFKYPEEPEDPSAEKVDNKPSMEDEMQNQLAAQLQLPSLAVGPGTGTGGLAAPGHIEQPALGAQTKVFAQTTRQMPKWFTVLKHFKDVKGATFLFVAWFMGFGIGLIFTFLFWQLHDYGGSPTLFGEASVMNNISEIFAYFFSFRIITQIGHVKVLCLGLIGNVLRFLYISWLRNPWWVLPFEFMQGLTHTAVWAACCSYIANNTPQHLRSSAQRVLQGIHHGLGRACGAVIGGVFVTYFGTTVTFRSYGIVCLLVLAGFVFINFCRKEQGFVSFSEISTTEDLHQVLEERSHLAPDEVPSNPIPRALSNSRLNDLKSK